MGQVHPRRVLSKFRCLRLAGPTVRGVLSQGQAQWGEDAGRAAWAGGPVTGGLPAQWASAAPKRTACRWNQESFNLFKAQV